MIKNERLPNDFEQGPSVLAVTEKNMQPTVGIELDVSRLLVAAVQRHAGAASHILTSQVNNLNQSFCVNYLRLLQLQTPVVFCCKIGFRVRSHQQGCVAIGQLGGRLT